ncbi:MAG: nucleotidyltransferase family protein [Bacteroidia bacterium]
MRHFEQLLISDKAKVSDVVRKLDSVTSFLKIEKPNLFVIDDNGKLKGSISDGDIRRALMKNLSSTDSVESIMKTNCRRIQEADLTHDKILEYKKDFIKILPIVNENDKVVGILDVGELNGYLGIEAVIMAGGRGERLRPLTDSIPKPMVPVGAKPIIEHNIDRLKSFGISKIHISVKYLADKIEECFGSGESKNISISYLREDEPLGTIGVVGTISDFESDTVLVMNSDLLTNIDFADMYKSYIESKAHLAIASIPYSVNVPYAVLEIENENVNGLAEKPTYTYYSNAGIYLISKKLLSLIPNGKHYNATDLIEEAIKLKYKVINFPIRGYWLDIGNHQDYAKAQQDISHIKF